MNCCSGITGGWDRMEKMAANSTTVSPTQLGHPLHFVEADHAEP